MGGDRLAATEFWPTVHMRQKAACAIYPFCEVQKGQLSAAAIVCARDPSSACNATGWRMVRRGRQWRGGSPCPGPAHWGVYWGSVVWRGARVVCSPSGHADGSQQNWPVPQPRLGARVTKPGGADRNHFTTSGQQAFVAISRNRSVASLSMRVSFLSFVREQ